MQGAGTIRRGPAVGQWPYECDNTPCWTYSLYDGAQIFSLQAISTAINLLTPGTAQSPPGVIALPSPGTGTTLQVSSIPTTIKGIQVPLRVISWSWQPRPGGDSKTTDGCTGKTTVLCNMTFTETGTVIVTGIVNGAEQVDTLIVRASEVQISAQKASMRPSIRYTQLNGTPISRLSKQVITVSVMGETGPIPNQTVSLLSDLKPES